VGWLRRRRDVPAEERANLFAASGRPPTWLDVSGGPSLAGMRVTETTAMGMPAISAAVRLLCETIAQLPLNVYRGRAADKRLADWTWQYRLLGVLPGMGDFTPFDLISDIVACLELYGNAYLQKVKGPGRQPGSTEVLALIVIDPLRVLVERRDGEKIFRVRNDQGHEEIRSAAEVLHIRGFTMQGADVGLSPIALHRQKLGSMIAQDEYQGRFFGQGTLNGVAVTTPNQLNEQQAERLLTQWRSQMGVTSAHLPLVLQNGTDVKRIGMTLADAQYVEGEKLNLLQAAHIFRIPASFLLPDAAGRAQSFEQDNLRFYTTGLSPRLKRIEMAMFADPDLFPQQIIYPEFDVRGLLRTDAKTQAEVDHMSIQDGSLLVDEKRARDGMPPLPDGAGQVPQITPVGGAPNPNTQDTTQDEPAPAAPTG
jgi:HK97 family phage portal protein